MSVGNDADANVLELPDRSSTQHEMVEGLSHLMRNTFCATESKPHLAAPDAILSENVAVDAASASRANGHEQSKASSSAPCTAQAHPPVPSAPSAHMLATAAVSPLATNTFAQLSEWASMIESTGHAANLEERLQHSELARKHAEAKSQALTDAVDRLTKEAAELRGSIATMVKDRSNGIKQISCLARAVAIAEQKSLEKDTLIVELQDQLSKDALIEELKAVREENAILTTQVEVLSERISRVQPRSEVDISSLYRSSCLGTSASTERALALSTPSRSPKTSGCATPAASASAKSPFVLARSKMVLPSSPSSGSAFLYQAERENAVLTGAHDLDKSIFHTRS